MAGRVFTLGETMFNTTIGDTIVISRPSGTIETYTLEGGREVVFRDQRGFPHTKVFEREYIAVMVLS